MVKANQKVRVQAWAPPSCHSRALYSLIQECCIMANFLSCNIPQKSVLLCCDVNVTDKQFFFLSLSLGFISTHDVYCWHQRNMGTQPAYISLINLFSMHSTFQMPDKCISRNITNVQVYFHKLWCVSSSHWRIQGFLKFISFFSPRTKHPKRIQSCKCWCC